MRLLQYIHHVDLYTFDWCLKRKHHRRIVSISRWVSRTADGYLYAFATIMAAYFYRWDIVKILAITFSVERLCYFFLKNKLKRNRPPQVIPGYQSIIKPADQFSFPSGHTSAAFLVGTIGVTYDPIYWLLLLLWAPLVGISRVMLGVHFPTDIVAGSILGISIAQICLYCIA
ncbi:phosphatase PAP2 family protein [Eionea flava]